MHQSEGRTSSDPPMSAVHTQQLSEKAVDLMQGNCTSLKGQQNKTETRLEALMTGTGTGISLHSLIWVSLTLSLDSITKTKIYVRLT